MEKRIQTFDLYAAAYTDNREKKLKGTAFGAVLIRGSGKNGLREDFGIDRTYMDATLKGIADFLSGLASNVSAAESKCDGAVITLHIAEPNVLAIVSKIGSVFDSLRGFEPKGISALIDRKLLRSNRSRYSHHDLQKQIVNALLKLDDAIPSFTLFVKKTISSTTMMRTAYQHAEDHLHEMNAALATPSNVVSLQGAR